MSNNFLLFNDDIGELEFVDTRTLLRDDNYLETLPTKIVANYTEDYNIFYLDEIIKKKLQQERYTVLPEYKKRYKNYEIEIMQPQTYVMRDQTLKLMEKLKSDIDDIESGNRLIQYEHKVKDILENYKTYSGTIKTVVFDLNDDEDEDYELTDEIKHRLFYIENFLEIASEYLDIDIVRVNKRPSELCVECGYALAKIATNEDGTQRCPQCLTEHDVIITMKSAKDGARINTNNMSEDESIDNFLRAFIRYQGVQTDVPPDSVYEELDDYFIRHGRPIGAEIQKCPLNARGRRGDTTHKMLWSALSQIGRSDYYEHANLIGHNYWGWTLPNVMHLRERIIDKYNKTQKGFYQIPPEERCRTSSLGTQYRLWRHLQLEDHECYIDEFKIAENPDSLRIHNRFWRIMCEACNDPEIYYKE